MPTRATTGRPRSPPSAASGSRWPTLSNELGLYFVEVYSSVMGGMVTKPDWIFDRDDEWEQLAGWATRAGGGRPRLGIVSGRRRQGKTYLLQALVEARAGFYFGATQATQTESLSLLADALTRDSDLPVPLRFASWDEAVRYLFAPRDIGPGPALISASPYLSTAAHHIPPTLHTHIDQ